jgi:hypothetical protein
MTNADEAVVSTDDAEIFDMAPTSNDRPPELCGDTATTQSLIDYMFQLNAGLHDSICLLQPTSPTRPDSLVRQLIAHGGQVRSVTNGVPNGQCYVYRKGVTGWTDIETEKGHDIDVETDFIAAEQDMLRRFQ